MNYSWVQTMQLRETPFHFLIKLLKALRFSAVLILTGRAFQIFVPWNLRLVVPKVTWFLLGIFKFILYLSRVTRFWPIFSSISFMKLGFKSLSILFISIQRNLSRRMFNYLLLVYHIKLKLCYYSEKKDIFLVSLAL